MVKCLIKVRNTQYNGCSYEDTYMSCQKEKNISLTKKNINTKHEEFTAFEMSYPNVLEPRNNIVVPCLLIIYIK